jgi:Phage P2 GpE
VSRAFDVAWFFHCAPSTVLALSVADFLTWERQAYRILALQREAAER